MPTYRIIDTEPTIWHTNFFRPQIRQCFIYFNLTTKEVTRHHALIIRNHINEKAENDWAFSENTRVIKPKKGIKTFLPRWLTTEIVIKYKT